MAAPVIVNVGGLIFIKVDYGEGLKTLGHTRNGVQYTEESFWGDVPGDENGGDEGPPVEVQYFGEIHRIRCELTKFDPAVAAKVAGKVAGSTDGTPAASGTLIFASTKYMRVLSTGTAPAGDVHARNYPFGIPRMPIELNAGTKFSTLVVEFEAHKIPDQNIMFNSSTS